MNQGESKAFCVGVGVAVLTECSNNPGKVKLPRLSLLNPAIQDPENGHILPAASLEVSSPRALYEALRDYYGDGKEDIQVWEPKDNRAVNVALAEPRTKT